MKQAFEQPIRNARTTAQKFLAGVDEREAWIDQRTRALLDEWSARPSNQNTNIGVLRDEARRQAGADWIARRREEAGTLRDVVAAVKADLKGFADRARTIVLPDPSALSPEENNRLMAGEKIIVVEQRRTQMAVSRMRVALEHQPLSIDERLAALERAQKGGDIMAAAWLDDALTVQLEKPLDDRLAENDRQARVARLEGLRDARIPADLSATIAGLQGELSVATAAAVLQAAQEALSADPRSNAAVLEVHHAQRAATAAKELESVTA
jgi:hypothetical protein